MAMRHRIASAFVQIVAERKFKEAVASFISGIPPEYLEYWAANNMSLEDVLGMVGKSIVPPKTPLHPGAEHLLSLPAERILALIEDVAPSHARILRKYPVYSEGVLRTLKEMLSGRN